MKQKYLGVSTSYFLNKKNKAQFKIEYLFLSTKPLNKTGAVDGITRCHITIIFGCTVLFLFENCNYFE